MSSHSIQWSIKGLKPNFIIWNSRLSTHLSAEKHRTLDSAKVWAVPYHENRIWWLFSERLLCSQASLDCAFTQFQSGKTVPFTKWSFLDHFLEGDWNLLIVNPTYNCHGLRNSTSNGTRPHFQSDLVFNHFLAVVTLFSKKLN